MNRAKKNSNPRPADILLKIESNLFPRKPLPRRQLDRVIELCLDVRQRGD
jgi:hypothetical protein